MGLPNTTYIDEYIRDGQQAILSLKNFYNTILVTNSDNRDHIIRIPWEDFFLRYRDELSESVQGYNLPDKYFYQPKRISYDLYGSTELWLGLMRLNSFKNITEFCQSFIYVYNPNDVKELINIFFKREGKIT